MRRLLIFARFKSVRNGLRTLTRWPVWLFLLGNTHGFSPFLLRREVRISTASGVSATTYGSRDFGSGISQRLSPNGTFSHFIAKTFDFRAPVQRDKLMKSRPSTGIFRRTEKR